jgi:hypothetical protein
MFSWGSNLSCLLEEAWRQRFLSGEVKITIILTVFPTSHPFTRPSKGDEQPLTL